MPTSTPAFQIAAMYGVRPDIPGFHFHDKRRGTDIHFPRAGHAALVKADHARGRRGILRGGSAYGCVFTGGAENDVFSFTRLKQPTGRGLLRMLSPFIVVGWVILKSLGLTLVELVRRALASLRLVDRSLRRLGRALRRVPEHQYDLFILSDYGQAPSIPYQKISDETPFERRVFEELLDPGPSRPVPPAASPRAFVTPPGVRVASPISHPIQLYGVFIRYQAN
ncbi:MAG: hypothetical protein ACRELA_16275 [Candidatus Rokuibacteriota bacterium]